MYIIYAKTYQKQIKSKKTVLDDEMTISYESI